MFRKKVKCSGCPSRPKRKAKLEAETKIRETVNVLRQPENSGEDEEYDWSKIGRVEVRQSLIEGAGNGVFATDNFEEDQIICEYVGKVRIQTDDVKNQNYDLTIPGFNEVLTGISDKQKLSSMNQVGSLVNSAFDHTEYKPNARYVALAPKPKLYSAKRFKQQKGTLQRKLVPRMWVVSTKKIKSGEEIFTNYKWKEWETDE